MGREIHRRHCRGVGIGALNGWTLIVTETSRAIAQDDLFPRPFAWTDRKGTAWFGILVGTALPTLLMLWRYNTSAGLTVFTYLVDLTVVTVAIPYFFSAIAQLTYLVSRRRRVQGWQLARDLSVAGASVLFSLVGSRSPRAIKSSTRRSW